MVKKFQRTIEDFTCEHCGEKVTGNGYTDHCPKCLWGKHVDINPGDRQAECRGMMEPIGIEMKEGKYRIRYKCVKCGHEFAVKMGEGDDFSRLVNLSTMKR